MTSLPHTSCGLAARVVACAKYQVPIEHMQRAHFMLREVRWVPPLIGHQPSTINHRGGPPVPRSRCLLSPRRASASS
jgi:hypothetical protein